MDRGISTRSPIVEEALTRIGALYAIEKTVRGQAPDVRLAARASDPPPSSRR